MAVGTAKQTTGHEQDGPQPGAVVARRGLIGMDVTEGSVGFVQHLRLVGPRPQRENLAARRRIVCTGTSLRRLCERRRSGQRRLHEIDKLPRLPPQLADDRPHLNRLGRVEAVFKGVPAPFRSAAGGPVHAADLRPEPPALGTGARSASIWRGISTPGAYTGAYKSVGLLFDWRQCAKTGLGA